MAYGMDAFIGISRQASMGTANTTSVDYAPFISESISEAIETLKDDNLRGGRYDASLPREGAHTIEGDIVMEVHPTLIGKAFQAWTNNNSAALVGSVYTHTFKSIQSDWGAASAVAPWTVEVYRGVDSSFQYSDMALNQFTLEVENGQVTRSTLSLIGGNFAFLAKTTPSYPSGSVYTWDVTSVSIGGAAASNVSQLSMTFNGNLEAKPTLNATKRPSRNKRTDFRMIEVSGTVFFDNDDEYVAWRARTERRFLVHMVGASITGSQNNTITVDLPSVVYDSYPVNIGGAGEVEVSFTGNAYYNAGSATAYHITLVNTKASY